MKKTLVSVLSLCLVLVMLFALAACGGKDGSGGETFDGTYYLYANGACDRSSYLRISGSTWSTEDGPGGSCTISGGTISLTYKLDAKKADDAAMIAMGIGQDGQELEFFSGTIGNGTVTLDKSMGIPLGSETLVFYLNGVVPDGANGNAANGNAANGNAANNGNTVNNGNAGAEGRYDGTYYMYAGGNECDMNSYIRLSGDNWSDEAGGYGRCVISGGNISLKYVVDSSEPTGALVISMGMANEGDVIDLMAGTVSDGKLTFTHSLGVSLGSEVIICYLNGVVR